MNKNRSKNELKCTLKQLISKCSTKNPHTRKQNNNNRDGGRKKTAHTNVKNVQIQFKFIQKT